MLPVVSKAWSLVTPPEQTALKLLRKVLCRWVWAIVPFAISLSNLSCCMNVAVAIGPENVLVLYNADDGQTGDGYLIADHYQQVRSGVHVAGISGISSMLPGLYSGQSRSDTISGTDYLNVIRPQVLSEIAALEASTGNRIDVIVTTKGMPLRIDAGTGSGSSWSRYSSLESELTRIDSIDSLDSMGDQTISSFPFFDNNLGSNPYYQWSTFQSPVPFSADTGIRLSSRLDGYSVNSVISAIDRAQTAFLVPSGQYIIADDTGFSSVDQITNGLGPGSGLVAQITNLYPDDGSPVTPTPLLFDQTNTAITDSDRPVIGYVSHGTNDGGGGASLGNNYLGEFVGGQFQPGEITFELANGAIFHSHESFNAESFDPNYPQDDAQVADWLEIGGTAGLGHVAEPNNGPDNVANEDILFEMLIPSSGGNAMPGEAGLTFVEAAWGSTRQLSYVNTVVGDPLMQIRAWLPGDANLDGIVDISDFGSLQVNFFQSGSFADGDFNADGVVDISDFGILQSNFFQSVNSTETALRQVPEPGSLCLLAALLTMRFLCSSLPSLRGKSVLC